MINDRVFVQPALSFMLQVQMQVQMQVQLQVQLQIRMKLTVLRLLLKRILLLIQITVPTWTFAGHQWASHQAKKSENKTHGIFFQAAFDFDAPRPRNTAQKWKNNQKPIFLESRFSKNDEILVWTDVPIPVFHAESESGVQIGPNPSQNPNLKKYLKIRKLIATTSLARRSASRFLEKSDFLKIWWKSAFGVVLGWFGLEIRILREKLV